MPIYQCNISLLLCFWCFLPREGWFLAEIWRRWTDLQRRKPWIVKKSLEVIAVVYRVVRCGGENILKNYFGGMEKGCIFASAFDARGWMLKSPEVGSESTLKRWEERDSVCRLSYIDRMVDTKTSQRGKNKQFLQWRVWSWLRMNASGRLNTCKSRGSRE